MSNNFLDVNIYGVKSTLEYLRRFEPDAYRAVTKEMRNTAKPIVRATAQQFPRAPIVNSKGISYWTLYGHDSKKKQRSDKGESGYSFPRYDITQVRKGVKSKVGGRKNKQTNSYPILRIIQSDGAGQIYDLAAEGHSVAGRAFVGKLNGAASRIMHPTVKKMMPSIRRDIEASLRQYEREFSDKIQIDMDKRMKLSASSSRQVRDALGRFGRMVR
jgi:hypothetical protein